MNEEETKWRREEGELSQRKNIYRRVYGGGGEIFEGNTKWRRKEDELNKPVKLNVPKCIVWTVKCMRNQVKKGRE